MENRWRIDEKWLPKGIWMGCQGGDGATSSARVAGLATSRSFTGLERRPLVSAEPECGAQNRAISSDFERFRWYFAVFEALGAVLAA